ncbi:ABC transporter ATP-binding protein [Acrocarpospora corrugata]|uniref:ABC transporter ATP-binding protein n=1 Tax=Acrocarpospora corrugata TaxID=35763 RepID=A0A5M3VPN3_9ACTN|nr:ABC transporter ATP-binding protein [Acrocarpospora corrugata]GER98744.1 ABC transporter ATP-binding protein [Acrocarpospora corrugata]
MTALEATGLGKRYRDTWALREVFLSVPRGRVVALVGPNGAGKTTLMRLAVGLHRPTTGHLRVFGAEPYGEALAQVAYVAQDKPLYDEFTVNEMLNVGRHLNPRFDLAGARDRLADLNIPGRARVHQLSGGQRAQLAITLAVAKRVDLIVLDEPLASLDPLARHEVMRGLMMAVAETGLTVLLSSHVVAELDEVCDHLVLLSRGRVQVAGDIEDILRAHRMLTGPAGMMPGGAYEVIGEDRTERQTSLFARLREPIPDPRWTAHELSLTDVVLGYMRSPMSTHFPPPVLAERDDVA